jgi:selenoprotein W-related protein
MGKPNVNIEYCPRCGWLLRAAWLAQELLTTFEADLGGVALSPSPLSGTFRIALDSVVVWDRKADGGFPHAAELKRRVRDRVAPERALGHSDPSEREPSEREPSEREPSERDASEREPSEREPSERERS